MSIPSTDKSIFIKFTIWRRFTFLQGTKLRLIQSPMRLKLSCWRPRFKRTLWVFYILPWCFLQLNKALKWMNRRERWGLLSKIVTNATNRICQHPPSWIFQMLRCILWSEMSLLLTTHIAGSQHSVLFQPWRHLPRALIWLDLNLKWAVKVIGKSYWKYWLQTTAPLGWAPLFD